MANDQPRSGSELQRQLDELHDLLAVIRADIDELRARADDAGGRADASEARADAANHRADASEARADEDHHRIGKLETRGEVDRKVITELREEGVLKQENIAQLHQALHSARKIGAAVGIIMAYRKISEADAFAVLSEASQRANRKLRLVADDVVFSGDVADLPTA